MLVLQRVRQLVRERDVVDARAAHEREVLAARVVVAGDLLAEDGRLDLPQVGARREQAEQLEQLLVGAPPGDAARCGRTRRSLAPRLRR